MAELGSRVRFDDDGRIVEVIGGVMLEDDAGLAVAGHVDPERWYVDPVSEALRERPSLGVEPGTMALIADGEDTLELPQVPRGATVRVRGAVEREFQVEDDAGLSLATLEPGELELVIDAFPYQLVRLTVHAEAPP